VTHWIANVRFGVIRFGSRSQAKVGSQGSIIAIRTGLRRGGDGVRSYSFLSHAQDIFRIVVDDDIAFSVPSVFYWSVFSQIINESHINLLSKSPPHDDYYYND
jgi:hypothetical protein